MFALCRPQHQLFSYLLWKGEPQNFGQKWPLPFDLSVTDIRWQIAAEWSETAQSSDHNGEPRLYETTLDDLNGRPTIGDPLRPPLPQRWESMHHCDTSNFKWLYLRNGPSDPLHIFRFKVLRGQRIEWHYFRFDQTRWPWLEMTWHNKTEALKMQEWKKQESKNQE